MKKRIATITRKTKETDIKIKLNIDGSGKAKINTGIGILDHMLELFAFHGLFDLEIIAKGDLKVDIHHTNEDIGIVLGKAFKETLGNMSGIKRFGSASVPMEKVVVNTTIDISGRPDFSLRIEGPVPVVQSEEGYNLKDLEHFLESFAKNIRINLVVEIKYPAENLHTTLEPIFKALGIALDQATQIDPRRRGIPSTKGVID
jgi:imidazoleglycerol-phosphate dehydratase